MLREMPTRIEDGAVSIDLAREATFALADMRVSPSSRELLTGGDAVMLQPRIMQVLVALARRRGAVVSRDELIHACWSGRAVGEDAINRCIQAIRRIAEQQGGFAVQTVARVGYRLIETAPVSDPGPAASQDPSGSSPREAGLAAPPGEPQNERRHLTVLSCSLVRGAGAAAPVDPEEWRATLEQYRLAVSEVVGPFGGHVAKGLGDNLTVHFGYPEAREDAAECAVRAGLAIVDWLGAQGAAVAGAADVTVRIGIHAGVVVVSQIGHDLEMFGEPPDGAAKVQALAAPGAVVVTGAVQALVAGLFVLEAQAPGPPVGGADQLPLYRVISAVPASRRGPHFAARDLTPYVGRDDEMRLLSSRWARVGRGEGQLVLLVGEPGIGKSRLVQEFRKRIEGDSHLWVECAGQRLNSNTPFYAVARMLDQVFRWRGDESRQERLEALELALDQSGLDLAEAVPLVAELLNLDVADRYPSLTLAPDQKRKRLLACLAAWVFNLVQNEPLIVVVEDLHWVDPSTMELLLTLVEQGATGPLLLLCTARPEFRAPWPMRTHHALLTLDRLSHDETRELVIGVVAKAGLSQDVIDTVIKRTDGVPLFAEELTRLMLESDGRAGEHDIPATLHDSLAARLAGTGRAEEVAQLGAVLGREFSYALIAAVSPMPGDQLQADLAKLADAELIYVRGVPPEANYQFKHALILDAALDALLKSRRRALHALVAQTISERFPALALGQPELLAGHWAEAGEPDKAVTAWVEAATVASARHAYQEAMQSYRQALAGLPALPEGPERDARELALLYALAEIAGVVQGHASDTYLELHQRAAGLAQRSGSLGQMVVQMLGRYVNALMSGQHPKALALADQLLDLSQREGGDMSLRLGHMAQVTARHGVGDLVGAETHLDLWSVIVARSGYGQFLGETAAVQCVGVEIAYLLGRADLARARVAEAMSVAQASDSPFEIMTALQTQAWLCVLLKEPAGAAAAAGRALAIAQDNAFTQVHQIRSSLAWARTHLGDTAGGVALADSCLSGWLGGGFPRLPEARRVLAQARALDGAGAQALADLDDLVAAPTDNPTILAAHLICRAELRLSLGQTDLAEADLHATTSLARPRQAKALELRAATHLARLLGARGEAQRARALLAPVYGWFTEGLDTADLREAKAVLEGLAQ